MTRASRDYASNFGVGVLVQNSFNTFAELVQLFLQCPVLGVVGFGGDGTYEFVQIIQGEVKNGPLA